MTVENFIPQHYPLFMARVGTDNPETPTAQLDGWIASVVGWDSSDHAETGTLDPVIAGAYGRPEPNAETYLAVNDDFFWYTVGFGTTPEQASQNAMAAYRKKLPAFQSEFEKLSVEEKASLSERLKD